MNKLNFADAIEGFRELLWNMPLVPILAKEELKNARRLVELAREYIIACRCKLEAKKLLEQNPSDPRGIELTCLFTHFELQPSHKVLGLRDAIQPLWKLQNFKTCAVLLRKLFELGISTRLPEQAEKLVKTIKRRNLLKKCEEKDSDAVELSYDPRGSFNICAASLTPFPKSDLSVEDPYTNAVYLPKYDGQVSPVCNLTKIGASANGLQFSSSNIQ